MHAAGERLRAEKEIALGEKRRVAVKICRHIGYIHITEGIDVTAVAVAVVEESLCAEFVGKTASDHSIHRGERGLAGGGPQHPGREGIRAESRGNVGTRALRSHIRLIVVISHGYELVVYSSADVVPPGVVVSPNRNGKGEIIAQDYVLAGVPDNCAAARGREADLGLTACLVLALAEAVLNARDELDLVLLGEKIVAPVVDEGRCEHNVAVVAALVAGYILNVEALQHVFHIVDGLIAVVIVAVDGRGERLCLNDLKIGVVEVVSLACGVELLEQTAVWERLAHQRLELLCLGISCAQALLYLGYHVACDEKSRVLVAGRHGRSARGMSAEMRAILLEEQDLGIVCLILADLSHIGLELFSLRLEERKKRVDMTLVQSHVLLFALDLCEIGLILRLRIHARGREVLVDDEPAEVYVV